MDRKSQVGGYSGESCNKNQKLEAVARKKCMRNKNLISKGD